MRYNGISAKEALERLKEGNKNYLFARTAKGDISEDIRRTTAEEGQFPYAIVLTCSDSRVIPESIFSASIGDIFTIRSAGNIVDDIQIGSIEYAVGSLGSRLIVVMGHTGCGAVSATLEGADINSGYVRCITNEIRKAIGYEKNEYKACILNVKNSMKKIEKALKTEFIKAGNELKIIGAVYDITDGKVDFL